MTVIDDAPRRESTSGRVLVLLDCSRLSLAALEAAADIAHARGAEVLGVFVEEINLLRSAGFGFTREVGASSGLARPLDAGQLEARMRSLSEQAQRHLERAVAGRGIPQALKRCRGQVVDEVLHLAGPEDLLVLGRVGWSGIPGGVLGSTARGLVHQAPGEVLLWAERQPRPQGRIVVLLNHDRGVNQRALGIGVELARSRHQPLTVLLRAETGADEAASNEIRDYLQGEGIPSRVKVLQMASAATVARQLREEDASQLIISRHSGLFGDQTGDELLRTLKLPITVTR